VPLVNSLLATCPEIKILATSRTSLHLRGEYEFPVSPLSLPDRRRPQPVQALAQNPAFAILFFFPDRQVALFRL
jgi:predicted ATPase